MRTNHPRRPCTQCGCRTASTTGLCKDCRPVKAAPKPTCGRCGIPTSGGKTGYCLPCWNFVQHGHINASTPEDHDSPNVLDPNLWVKDGRGIKRYVSLTTNGSVSAANHAEAKRYPDVLKVAQRANAKASKGSSSPTRPLREAS